MAVLRLRRDYLGGSFKLGMRLFVAFLRLGCDKSSGRFKGGMRIFGCQF